MLLLNERNYSLEMQEREKKKSKMWKKPVKEKIAELYHGGKHNEVIIKLCC